MFEKSLDEHEIVKKWSEGCIDSYNELYNRYNQYTLKLIKRWVSDQGEAEQLNQEVWLKVFRFAKGFQGRSLFLTWVYRVTVNTVKNYATYKDKKALFNQADLSFYSKDDDNQNDSETLEILATDAINGCVESEVQGLAIEELGNKVLSESSYLLQENWRLYSEGLSNQQIADILNVPEVSVRVAQFKVRRSFSNEIELYKIKSEMSHIQFIDYLLDYEDSNNRSTAFQYLQSMPDDDIELYTMLSNGKTYQDVSEWLGLTVEQVGVKIKEISNNVENLVTVDFGSVVQF